eukprot:gene17339-19070_t
MSKVLQIVLCVAALTGQVNGYSVDVADSPVSCGLSGSRASKNDAFNPRKRRIFKRVLGGGDSQMHAWPWHALISGVLVSTNILLTVAQCTPSTNPQEYMVLLGEHDVTRFEGNETLHKVKKVIVPRAYNKTALKNDIALVILQDNIPQNSRTNYVCLPAPSYYTMPGASCYMTGWGVKQTSRGLRMARKLQEVKLQVIFEDMCEKVLKKRLPDSQMCAGNTNSTAGGCHFDKGSPLVCYDDRSRRWVLQGLFSYSTLPCSSNKTRHSLFTRISVFSRALQKVINKAAPTRRPLTTKLSLSTGRTSSSAYSTTTSTTQKTVLSSTTKGPATNATFSVLYTTAKPVTTLQTSSPPISKSVTTSGGIYPKMTKPLKIYMRSEGCHDKDKTGSQGQAYIIVNGIDYSSHKRGHNIVIVDIASGKVERNISFDTSKYSEFVRMKEFLLNVRPRKVLLVGVQSDGSRHQVAIKELLARFGATHPYEVSLCSTYCLMGYSGPGRVNWIRQNSRKSFQGPSEIEEVVPLDDKLIRIKIESKMVSNESNSKPKGVSHIWLNGVDVSPHVDGHNLVTINFDTGLVEQKLGFRTADKLSENRILAKMLSALPQRKIIIVVTQSGNSDYNWMIRKALGSYGASSELEIEKNKLYAFVGFSGPERVSWTAETRSKSGSKIQDIKLKVFIRKGYSTCGLSSQPLPRLVKHVVGGRKSSKGHWPWMASIINYMDKLVCGAVLINEQWVLTAAHCLDEVTMKTSLSKVVLGSEKYFGGTGSQKIDIMKMFSHPKYDRVSYDYDVALIKLQQKARIADDIRSICFDKENRYNPDDCYVSGWGRIAQGGTYPDDLNHVKVPIVPTSICNSTKTYKGKITSRMICAGYKHGGADACQGDSGGPLSCKDLNGYWHLAGVVSWGAGCAMPNHYGVYSNVNVFKEWIFATMTLEDSDKFR